MEVLKRKCRLCLKKPSESDTVVNLFEDEIVDANGKNYANEILDLLNIEVEDSTNWPPNACMGCIDFLDQMSKFHDQILMSHKALAKEILCLTETITQKEAEPSTSAAPELEETHPETFDFDFSGVDTSDDDTPPPEPVTKKPKIETKTRKLKNDKKLHKTSAEEERKRVEAKRKRLEDEKLEDLARSMDVFKCKVCDRDTENLADLINHVRDNHDIGSYEYCCDRRLDSRAVVLDHILFHMDPSQFQCKICNAQAKTRGALKLHMDRLHTTQRHFTCEVCGNAFASNALYRDHKRRKHPEIRSKCYECDKEFAHYSSLHAHIRKCHLKLANFICEICGKMFASKALLNSHIYYHGGPHGAGKVKKRKPKPTFVFECDSYYTEENESKTS